MKYLSLFAIVLIFWSCMDQSEVFDYEKLTFEQKSAYERFKQQGRDYKDWNTIADTLPFSKKEPFGKPEILMSKEQVLNFIGEPDKILKDEEGESLNYLLEKNEDDYQTAFILIKNNKVLWFGLSTGLP